MAPQSGNAEVLRDSYHPALLLRAILCMLHQGVAIFSTVDDIIKGSNVICAYAVQGLRSRALCQCSGRLRAQLGSLPGSCVDALYASSRSVRS